MMPAYTDLRDCDIDMPLSNERIASLLAKVRESTEGNWQVVERQWYSRRWFYRVTNFRYALYLHRPHEWLPWEIVFMSTGHYATADVLLSYLQGLLDGISCARTPITPDPAHG